MSRQGGAGFEAAGDPTGGGGALHVLRARCVEGQTVRVVFNLEPRHKSPAGTTDGLNSTNYVLAVTGGSGIDPIAVGVKRDLIVGPAAGVEAGEFALDVQTDRALVDGLTYSIRAQNIQANDGSTLGYPYQAPFVGMVHVKTLNPPKRMLANLDFFADPVTGGYKVDDSGDVAVQGGLEGLKKRIVRRLITPKGAFAFLPDYGLGQYLKFPIAVQRILVLKTEAAQQIGREPEVAQASVNTRFLPAQGILFVQVKAKTKTGLVLEFETRHSPNAAIVIA